MNNQNRVLILAASAITTLTLGADSVYQLGDTAYFHVMADVSAVYEDNVLLQPNSNKQDDISLVFTPGVELRMDNGGSSSTLLRYQHTFTYYDSLSELDGNYAHLTFKTHYDSGVAMFNLNASYEEQYSNSYGIDQALDAYGILVLRDRINVSGNMKYQMSELTAFGVGADYNDVDYRDSRFTDHQSFAVPVSLFYKIRPTLDLTAGVRYRETDTSIDLKYEDWYYFVGAVGELFSPVFYADLNVGFQERNTKSGVMPDADTTAYNLTVYYTGSATSTIYASIARDYRTSANQALTYAYSSASVGANLDLTTSISLNGSFAIAKSEYEESIREEDINIVRVGASYSPNDYFKVSASYYFRDVDGNVVNYTDNEVRVTASLRY